MAKIHEEIVVIKLSKLVKDTDAGSEIATPDIIAALQSVAEELVGLIAAQRAYEITTKGISASDQMLQRLSQLARADPVDEDPHVRPQPVLLVDDAKTQPGIAAIEVREQRVQRVAGGLAATVQSRHDEHLAWSQGVA